MGLMRRLVATGVVFVCVVSSMPAQALMLSKEYEFKPDVELVIGAEVRHRDVEVRHLGAPVELGVERVHFVGVVECGIVE